MGRSLLVQRPLKASTCLQLTEQRLFLALKECIVFGQTAIVYIAYILMTASCRPAAEALIVIRIGGQHVIEAGFDCHGGATKRFILLEACFEPAHPCVSSQGYSGSSFTGTGRHLLCRCRAAYAACNQCITTSSELCVGKRSRLLGSEVGLLRLGI